MRESHAADAREEALKAIFSEVFSAMIRPSLTAVESQAIPHRAHMSVLRQAITADGLAFDRPGAEEAYTRQLYRQWKARNPRRGLHMLTQYLQMLWPDMWECAQLWHDAAKAYPSGLALTPAAGRWLTSRVLVQINGDDASGADLLQTRGSLRSLLAARFLLLVALLRKAEREVGIATLYRAVDVYSAPSIIARN
ncbi:hypothetical protein [Ideonella livida]|uniref:Uncharacterized protein n=1 Tax=Ideonella livida TaxID=2707176 RepID=A0A7C9PEH4_9BURK|nr:hypothetical protein [Ideonella livida]NDY89735.1 hypothetical protein [Ideonella livida]